MEPAAPKFNTYIEVAQNLFAENPDFYTEEQQNNILSFAKFLDSGRVLNSELQMLAIQQARKIDYEVLMACCDEFGRDNVTKVVKKVYDKHRHSKKFSKEDGAKV